MRDSNGRSAVNNESGVILISFANAWMSPICDIEPVAIQRYIRECRSRPSMTTNRRESPRTDIKLRCHITSPGLWAQSTVVTENISRSGVLMAWRHKGAASAPPSIGQILTVEIELPANHGFGQKCIHCQGTVLRVAEVEPSGILVALRVNYMDFRAFHDRLRSVQTLQPVANSWMA